MTAQPISRAHDCGIYTITSPSGSQYVGSAVNFERRWAKHRTELRGNAHGNSKLTRAFAKYGIDRLIFAKILICDKADLLTYEQIAIDVMKPEYNICKIANSRLGIKADPARKHIRSAGQRNRAKPSEATRHKLALAKLGTKRTDESKRKTSESLKLAHQRPEIKNERIRTAKETNARPEVREKISMALTGIKRSDETRARMSDAQRGHLSTLKGVPRTPAVIAKLTGQKRSDETRARMSIAQKLAKSIFYGHTNSQQACNTII